MPCRRPFVITGGELTLEMLDLRYDHTGHFYEAPLHMKALGGCFLIDDFGRQLVSPANLLNRWIVPLESRVDYLKLHTGKSFSIPFEELVIFSTNLEPEDLMDPAFLRRLPYKIEVGPPDPGGLPAHLRTGMQAPRHDAARRRLCRDCHQAEEGERAGTRRLPAPVHRRPGGGHLPVPGQATALRAALHRLRDGQPAREAWTHETGE